MPATRKHGDSMRTGSQVLPAKAMTGDDARHTDFLWIAGALTLAFALRVSVLAGSGGVSTSCDEPFVQQVAPILDSANPLHYEVFFYPPVPAMIVAGLAAIWRLLGGSGPLTLHCGSVGFMFSLATVGVVGMLGRFWGRLHGSIAMALYAVTMIAVVVRGNVQVYSTFFLCLAIYCILRAANGGRIWTLILAGVWLGLGVASKYSPIFFGGLLFVPYALQRWTGKPVAEDGMVLDTRNKEGTFVPRIWTGSAWTLVGLTCATLWIALIEKPLVYNILRHIYERHSHENPFEYHLPWIDRLYSAALAGVGLVGLTAGVALLIPWMRGVPTWQWARSFFARHRLWVVPWTSLVLTITLAIGLPAVLNLNDFTRHFVHLAKGRASGDNGFFPGHYPAPSYIGAYIPESTGLLLFLAGLVGVLYALVKRDKRAALLIAGTIPAYLVLELSRVKVNRYALELLPLWCLLAALWMGDLCRMRDKVWRAVGVGMVAVVVAYSTVYTLAWAEFFGPRANPQAEAGAWLTASIPPGTSLGVRSGLLVSGSPELLPASDRLAPYTLADYTEEPEYVLLPNAVHAVVTLYLGGSERGYIYTASDWFASAPNSADLRVLTRIVREDGYILLKEFTKHPVAFGMTLSSDSVTGRTWLAEHSTAIGIRVYRRIAARR